MGLQGPFRPKLPAHFGAYLNVCYYYVNYGRHHHYSNSRFLIGLATPALEQSFKT